MKICKRLLNITKHRKKVWAYNFLQHISKQKTTSAKILIIYEKHDETFKKANLHKFPYSAYYEVEEPKQEVTINGVIHQSRNPELIKDKLKNSKKN